MHAQQIGGGRICVKVSAHMNYLVYFVRKAACGASAPLRPWRHFHNVRNKTSMAPGPRRGEPREAAEPLSDC